jgi:hypothetical protein
MAAPALHRVARRADFLSIGLVLRLSFLREIRINRAAYRVLMFGENNLPLQMM